MEDSLSKYNIDATSCIQRRICERVKNSMTREAENGAMMDKFIATMANSDWAMKFISGTAIEQAIQMGKSDRSCIDMLSNCTMPWPMLQGVFNYVIKH